MCFERRTSTRSCATGSASTCATAAGGSCCARAGTRYRPDSHPKHAQQAALLRSKRCVLAQCQGAGVVERQGASVFIVLRVRVRVELRERSREPTVVEDLMVGLPLRAD